jgi:hypothetical protein
VLDISTEGCAFLLQPTRCPLSPGMLLRAAELELDDQHFVFTDLRVQHLTPAAAGLTRGGARGRCLVGHAPHGAGDAAALDPRGAPPARLGHAEPGGVAPPGVGRGADAASILPMSRADLMGLLLAFIARLITGAQGHWKGCPPKAEQRIYFANHQSHLDWVLIWAALPRELRARTRPIAARDYWTSSPFKQWLTSAVFNAVYVAARAPTTRTRWSRWCRRCRMATRW